MKILFDNGVPKPIALSLVGHEIAYARKIDWHELKNGDLILQAEEAGYELLLSTDKNIRYQQNLTRRKIAIVVLGNQQWSNVRLHLDRIVAAVERSHTGLLRGSGHTLPRIACPYFKGFCTVARESGNRRL
jgi:hypothetical protein